MSLLFVTHEYCYEHMAGEMHPERPERLDAVKEGLRRAGTDEAVEYAEAPRAPFSTLVAVHDVQLIDHIRRVCESGGGVIDADTVAAAESYRAARLAAGAGLRCIDGLREGEAEIAFASVRPPGHHATKAESMGFCLFNNVAVSATELANAGERVLIVDVDAHHGNGTQDIFYDDPRVMFVSFHQWPCYPGTGWLTETGAGAAVGTTINLPLPPGATGDVYLKAWDTIVQPAVDRFEPTWLLISAGFDAHRRDPITDLGLSAGDYRALTERMLPVVEKGRTVVFLEGGYDLEGLAESSAAMFAAVHDASFETEAETNGGPGNGILEMIAKHMASIAEDDVTYKGEKPNNSAKQMSDKSQAEAPTNQTGELQGSTNSSDTDIDDTSSSEDRSQEPSIPAPKPDESSNARLFGFNSYGWDGMPGEI